MVLEPEFLFSGRDSSWWNTCSALRENQEIQGGSRSCLCAWFSPGSHRKLSIPSGTSQCQSGVWHRGRDDQREREKGSKFLVMPHFVGPMTKKWCPASMCIILPTFFTILNTQDGEKKVYGNTGSAHTDKLKTFGNSKNNSTKCSNLQKAQLVIFWSCKNYSISSLLWNFTSCNLNHRKIQKNFKIILKKRKKKKERERTYISSTRERRLLTTRNAKRRKKINTRAENWAFMADLWSAGPALVGTLPKGKPQLCLESKARRVDMVKHNKQAASFHSGGWAGQNKLPELKQAHAKNNFISPSLSQGPNYLSSTWEG